MKKHFGILMSISLAILFVFTGMFCCAGEKKKESAKKASVEKTEPAKKTYLLRYHFKPGETVCWQVVQRGRNETTVSGTTKTLETVSKSTKVWKIIKINDDGSAVFENQVQDVDMWQKMTGNEEVHYNSKKDKKPPHGFEGTAERIGKPLARITLDQRGDVQKRVELVKEISHDSKAQITIPLPKKAIPVGHTWRIPHDIYVPLDGGRTKKVIAHQSFTLKNVKNDIATIQVSTQILTPIRDPSIEVKLIDQYRRGTVQFDILSGRILALQMDLDKRVIGFSGPDSRIHYLTRVTERLQTLK